MKRLFRSHIMQPFASRSRAAWMVSVLVAALAILLTSTATYASTASTPGSVHTTLATSSVTTSGATLKLTSAPNTDHFPCPADNICLYPGVNYTGLPQIYPFPGVNQYVYLGGSWITLSYINNGDYRGWLNQFTTGNHGISYCMAPNSRLPDITGPWITDQWLLLSTNTASC